MIAIGELQLLACLTCGVVVAGYVFTRYARKDKKINSKQIKKKVSVLNALKFLEQINT